MTKTLYTARARVTGGRSGHGRSSDGALEVHLRPAAELGGSGEGTNPEQLFAVAYAACFDGALGSAARRSKADLGEICPYSNATRGNVKVTLLANGLPA